MICMKPEAENVSGVKEKKNDHVPSLQVESTLPEDGVHFLPEDSRIIGLIYTAKTNMMKK